MTFDPFTRLPCHGSGSARECENLPGLSISLPFVRIAPLLTFGPSSVFTIFVFHVIAFPKAS